MNTPDTAERINRSDVKLTDAGERLDVYLSRRFTYNARHQWQKLIAAGCILLNGETVRPARRLNAGDTVLFKPPEDTVEPAVETAFRVLYEDEHFLVVDKPGNLPVHPGGIFFKNTLWSFLRPRYGNVHIVTRLDRETSGLVLIGRTAADAKALAAVTLNKVYYALVFGAFKTALRAEGYLMQDQKSDVRKKRTFSTVENEALVCESAVTDFEPRACSADNKVSLVACTLQTGRLHQIRATLCALNFPLVGDKLYGPDDHYYLRFIHDRISAQDYAVLIMRRQALHAAELRFEDPFTHEQRTFTAPFPDDMQTVCAHYNLPIQE